MFKFTLSLCALAAGLSAGQVYTFGMVGIAEGQVARVNALNPGVAVPAAGVACVAQLTFLDGQGDVLKTTVVNVLPGKEAYLDLIGITDLALPIDARKQIRATITIPPTIPPPTAITTNTNCTLIGTLEIFDSVTGKTQIVLGGTHLVQSPTATTASPTP